MPDLRFVNGSAAWSHERDGVLFMGRAGAEDVEFIVTGAALSALLGKTVSDARLGWEVFIEFEAELMRIARREWRKNRAGPVVIDAAAVT